MRNIGTPLSEGAVDGLKVGDRISISGYIFAGRDAVLPKLVKMAQSGELAKANVDLQGGVIFHTAVSCAGVGPTSTNKLEIEGSIGPLSKHGVRLHLGKGAIRKETIEALALWHSAYAVIPPVTALLNDRILLKEVLLFPEEGMEAFHLLKVENVPAIVAAVNGQAIY
jgi:fumarate hydratase subunit beta